MFTPVTEGRSDFILITTRARKWWRKGEVEIFGEDNFLALSQVQQDTFKENVRKQGFILKLRGP